MVSISSLRRGYGSLGCHAHGCGQRVGPRLSWWRLPVVVMAVAAGILASAMARGEEWEMVSGPIFEQIPDYKEIQGKLYRRVGGIVVLPGNGHIFAVLNRDYGVFKSEDHGETWVKLENAPVQGRLYGSFSISLDAATGRFAVFTQETNQFKIDPVGGMTLDGGATWTALPRPAEAGRHDGFTWGGVDWTVAEPKVLLGKQHHAWVDIWMTRDTGQSWERVDFKSRNVGVIDEDIFVAGVDKFVTDRHPKIEPGIYRSADAGETWERVSEVVVNGKGPVHYEGSFYWTCAEGVLVSHDKGASWELTGAALPGAVYGPYFGREQSRFMVVSGDGFFQTRDGGASWEKLADAPTRIDATHPTVSFGWDPGEGYLYYAPVGGDVHRLKVEME